MRPSKEQVEAAVETLNYQPLDRAIVVLIPEISRKTDSGLLKSDEQIKREEEEMDLNLTVVAVSEDSANKIQVGNRVLLKSPGFKLNIECPVQGFSYGQMSVYDCHGIFKD